MRTVALVFSESKFSDLEYANDVLVIENLSVLQFSSRLSGR